MKHMIKKQVIELRLGDPQQALRIQHLFSEHYNNDLIPLMESVFDDYSNEGIVLTIDRLEVDFGFISRKELERTKWDEHLLNAFRSNLRRSLALLAEKKGLFGVSKAMNDCNQWLAYMQTGYLSWNTTVINDTWYRQVLETLATDYRAIEKLREAIVNIKAVAERISLQHDIGFLTTIVEIITASSQAQLAAVATEVYKLIKLIATGETVPFPREAVFTRMLWQQFLRIAAAAPGHITTKELLLTVLQPYLKNLPARKKDLKKLLSQIPLFKQWTDAIIDAAGKFQSVKAQNEGQKKAGKEKENLQPSDDSAKNQRVSVKSDRTIEKKEYEPGSSVTKVADDKNWRQKKDEVQKKSDKTEIDTGLPSNKAKAYTEPESRRHNPQDNEDIGAINGDIALAGEQHAPDKILKSENIRTGKNESTADSLLIPEDGIFIVHAGLVLTHPFLAFLFRRLQWMEGHLFLNVETRMKAVFMLHYLATGKTAAMEHETALCKIMCGWPLEEPLQREINFTPQDKQEADDMLKALIDQWGKLGNTSVAGLREEFLQRDGKLYVKNEEFVIQVEKKATDILLGYLPWNISLIKIPWMKTLLRVEWC